jgi:hypothetical protein
MKIFVRIFFLLFLWILPFKISEACGPYDLSFSGYSFVNPNILNQGDKAAPYFLTFRKLYEFYQPEKVLKVNVNLAEWQDRFCGLVEKKDLEYIIYQASIEDLELLSTATKSKNLPIPYLLKGNSFAEYAKNQKCVETIDYLIFAKKCEPHVGKLDRWSGAERDVEAMYDLIDEGRKEFKKTASPYIKLRYTFQLVRLAHYAKDYELTIKLNDILLPKVDKEVSRMEESFLKWWILGHKAGAMMGLGQNIEASYLFSLIFENCPSRRESAYRSFFIRTDQEWIECEKLCESDHERATLHALRANAAQSKAIEEMEKIYEFEAQSHHLEVLLVKEILKMEKNLLGLEFNDKKRQNQRRFGIPEPYVGDHIIRLQAFTKKCADENKVARPILWRIAEGYLQFLAGNNYEAKMTFEEILPKVEDEALKEQILAFETAMKIGSFDKVNEQIETEIYQILKDNEVYKKYKDFPDYMRDKLSKLYKDSGHPGKAFLCEYPISDLKPNPKEEIIRDLLLTNQSDSITTAFERLLMQDNKGVPITNALLDMKALNLMREYQWEAALQAYRGISREVWDDFGVFMPFRETIKDCVHCLYRRDTIEMYNRGELLEELLDLESKARGRLSESARHYYRIGLGLYNMSYFGHSWQAMDYYRSGSSWSRLFKEKDNVFETYGFPFGNVENLDVSRALYYFEKARQAAPAGSEIGARATFQAARCEQKMYFMSDQYRSTCDSCMPQLPEMYLSNFQRLKEDYADTKFYAQAIQECKYFKAYVMN